MQKQLIADIYIWRSLFHNKFVKSFFFAESTIIGHPSFNVLGNFACLMLEAVQNIWVRCSTIVMHGMRGFPGREFPGIQHPGLDTLTAQLFCWCYAGSSVCACAPNRKPHWINSIQQVNVGPPQVLRHVWVKITYQLDIHYAM